MMMNGELAGFTIPRLGMGTMALAIEGRPDRDTAIRTIHAGLDAGVRYLDTAWSYYLPSEPGTGTAEDLGTAKSWCVMRSLRGMAPEMKCSSPRKLAIDAPWRSPLLLLLVVRFWKIGQTGCRIWGTDGPIHQNRTLRGGILRDAAVGLARNASICRRPGSQYGWMADSRPETMIRDAKESALHLGVVRFDLLYSHGPDPAVPYEDQCGAD